jgi:small nuclear ribonucleoprotein (snRNP)-like protein
MGYQSLKEAYNQKRKGLLKEKLNKIEQRNPIISEVLEKQTLEQSTISINSLKQYKGNIDALDQIIDIALTDVKNYVTKSGGTLEKLLNVIQTQMGSNPIINALILTNALENGFRQLTSIIQSNVGTMKDPDIENKTIIEILPEVGKQVSISTAMEKAFSPIGLPTGTSEIPYLDGNSKKTLIDSIMNTPVNKLNVVVQQTTGNRSSRTILNAMLASARQQTGSIGTKQDDLKKISQRVERQLTSIVGSKDVAIKVLRFLHTAKLLKV